MGVPVWHIPPLVYLLMAGSAASTGQRTWYAQPAQVPKASNFPLLEKKMLFWGEEIVTFIIFMFHCMCLFCCCGICLQCSHIATKGDTSVLDTSVLPLHD